MRELDNLVDHYLVCVVGLKNVDMILNLSFMNYNMLRISLLCSALFNIFIS